MGSLPKLDLALVKEAVDIRSLLLKFFNETEFSGALTYCPFHVHHRDTPSFHVRGEGARFFCYACQCRGDVIDFVQLAYTMKTGEALTFPQAVRILCRLGGLPDPESEEALLFMAKTLRVAPGGSSPELARVLVKWAHQVVNPLVLEIRNDPRPLAPDVACALAEMADGVMGAPYLVPSKFQDSILAIRELARWYLASSEEIFSPTP